MEVTSYSVTLKFPMALYKMMHTGTYSPEQLVELMCNLENDPDASQVLALVKWAHSCSAREVKVVSLLKSTTFTFFFGCIDFLEDFDRGLYFAIQNTNM